VFGSFASPRVGPITIEYASMALLFRPQYRALLISFLLLAASGVPARASALPTAAAAQPSADAAPAAATASKASPKPAATAAAAAADTGAGAKLYQLACATCHMPDGTGVSGMQPALVGSKIVMGPAATMAKVILLGPDKALPGRPKTSANIMPAFDSLSDEDIAAIATYVRKTFGKGASAVTPAQVKAQRPK
jgi:mono/diheme cytochrome c family protein